MKDQNAVKASLKTRLAAISFAMLSSLPATADDAYP
jgi:hypothetical protein